MSTALVSLVWFALWAVMLVMFVALLRVREVMGGRSAPNAFPSGDKHGADAYWRINRAQANTVENLPIFAALVLSGVAAGLETPIFGTLCAVAVFARMAQSLIHMSSGSNMAVNLRFAAFGVQLVCFVWIGIELLKHFYAS